MALAVNIEARFLEVFLDLEVVAGDGEVLVSVKGLILQEEMIIRKVIRMISGLKGIRNASIGIAPSIYVPF